MSSPFIDHDTSLDSHAIPKLMVRLKGNDQPHAPQ